MKEHPILFSGRMVRAILDGKKTQTRRVVKQEGSGKVPFTEELQCPYGLTGDRLWVRETWCLVDDTEFGAEKWIDYRATPRYAVSHPAGWDNAPNDAEALKWKPSIHMPRTASRIILEITQLRIEKLQCITEEDAIAEGFDGRYGFINLWDEINAKRGYSWESNPFVWVISFKKICQTELSESHRYQMRNEGLT